MIRPYKKKDISKIVELEKKYLISSLTEEFYKQDLKNSFAKHYVIVEENKMIGFISSFFDGTQLEVLNFVIDGPYQSQGYGTKMINMLWKKLLPLGMKSTILEVRKSNVVAIHFYEKLGFKIIHIRKQYYQNQEDAYVMEKTFSKDSFGNCF